MLPSIPNLMVQYGTTPYGTTQRASSTVQPYPATYKGHRINNREPRTLAEELLVIASGATIYPRSSTQQTSPTTTSQQWVPKQQHTRASCSRQTAKQGKHSPHTAVQHGTTQHRTVYPSEVADSTRARKQYTTTHHNTTARTSPPYSRVE